MYRNSILPQQTFHFVSDCSTLTSTTANVNSLLKKRNGKLGLLFSMVGFVFQPKVLGYLKVSAVLYSNHFLLYFNLRNVLLDLCFYSITIKLYSAMKTLVNQLKRTYYPNYFIKYNEYDNKHILKKNYSYLLNETRTGHTTLTTFGH